ncbi:MAG: hypothetical protein AVDCRST_MAG11-4027, partial [uncultured Gemmatimonadaceae bacterium]
RPADRRCPGRREPAPTEGGRTPAECRGPRRGLL